MKNRGVRPLIVILAVAAQAAAGFEVWQYEQRIAAGRSAADLFERDARQAVITLADLRAAQQAYVADGQPSDVWLARAATLGEAIHPKLTALHVAAASVEAQGALESGIEAFATFSQSDAKARDYMKSGQRLSASDVIFADGASSLGKVVNAIDNARGQESVARAVVEANERGWELVALGAATLVTLLALVLLVPIPRAATAEAGGEAEAAPRETAGLGLADDVEGVVRRAEPIAPRAAPGRAMRAAPALAMTLAEDGPIGPVKSDAAFSATKMPDLAAVADLCSSLARVQDSRELQGLLERAAKTLDAIGVIVWMPGGPQDTLHPALSHGYAPAALARMGTIHPAAGNATATAFRTKTAMVVPAEALARGAVVAPLITADGCSGVMAVELRKGVATTEQIRAVATILAAQFATLLTPAASATTPAPAAILTTADAAPSKS